MQALRIVLLAAVAAMAVAATASQGAAPARASCAPVIGWRGGAYFGGFVRRDGARPAGRLSRGTIPGCNDTGGADEPDTPVAVRRVAGVDPRIAVWAGGDLYVAAGYFPQLPGFPLARWHVDRGRSCRERASVSVVARTQSGSPGVVSATLLRAVPQLRWPRGHRLFAGDVDIDSKTRFAGLRRAGLPYLGPGQRIRARALACRRSHGWTLVLRSVRPAGPVVSRPVPLAGGATAAGGPERGWIGTAVVAAVTTGFVLLLAGPSTIRRIRR